jgi:outer membrane lipoprotein-sorting protein
MNLDENTFARMIEQAGADDTLRPEHQQQLREQALAVFDLAQAKPTRPGFGPTKLADYWRWIMRSPVSRIAAAIVFAVAIGGVALLFHGSGAAYVLADFIQPIIDAKTATCKMTIELPGRPTATTTLMVSGNRMRQTMPGNDKSVMIQDLEKGKSVSLDLGSRRAMIVNIKNMPKEKSDNAFGSLRTMLLDSQKNPDMKRESLGEKEVDGHRAIGYRLTHRLQVMTLWGDPKTGQPIRVEMSMAMFPGAKMTMSDFVFNPKLDESLFSTDPPPGYTVETTEVDASPGAEKDFIEALRRYVELSGGPFPDSLDMQNFVYGEAYKRLMGSIIPKNMAAGINEPTPEQAKQIVEVTTKLSRGSTFVMSLPADAEAHYAGKGVSKGSPDRPIFWYRPKDTKKYRVVFADLTVRDADVAPKAPDAKSAPGQPGYVPPPPPSPTRGIEKDLGAVLRSIVVENAGVFPDKFGMSEVQAAIDAEMGRISDKAVEKYGGKEKLKAQYGKKLPPANIMADVMKAVQPTAERQMRLDAFFKSLRADNQLHYAGKGVKFRTPDRPILWFKPTGSQKYKVIYADLTIRDADAAPTAPNAEPIPLPPDTTKKPQQ